MSELRKPTAEDPQPMHTVLAKWSLYESWREVQRRWAGGKLRWFSYDDSWSTTEDPIAVAALPGPCPSCAELRAESFRLQREVERLRRWNAEAVEVIHNIGADRLNCRALMAEAVRDFHGKGSLFSAAFLEEAGKEVLEPED